MTLHYKNGIKGNLERCVQMKLAMIVQKKNEAS